MDNEWIDLELGNIPSDFFVNENYEVQIKLQEWEYSNMKSRPRVIHHLLHEYKYRYRAKSLESIRVTRDVYNMIFQECIKWNHYGLLRAKTDHHEENLTLDGRKVEIIN